MVVVLSLGIEVFLHEAGRRIGGRGAAWSAKEAVGAGEGAEIMVEQLVLVKNHEHVLHLLAQKANKLVPLVSAPMIRRPGCHQLAATRLPGSAVARRRTEASMVATMLRPRRTQLSP